jgi:transposase
MAFVMVLSHSRQIFLRFFPDARMENFLRGHVGAFTAWGGVPRVLLYDYVPGHIIRLLCRSSLCGGGCSGA